MPIIVDEVVITVEVTGGAPPGNGEQSGGAAGAAEGDRHALVEECVERVLEVLERRKER